MALLLIYHRHNRNSLLFIFYLKPEIFPLIIPKYYYLLVLLVFYLRVMINSNIIALKFDSSCPRMWYNIFCYQFKTSQLVWIPSLDLYLDAMIIISHQSKVNHNIIINIVKHGLIKRHTTNTIKKWHPHTIGQPKDKRLDRSYPLCVPLNRSFGSIEHTFNTRISTQQHTTIVSCCYCCCCLCSAKSRQPRYRGQATHVSSSARALDIESLFPLCCLSILLRRRCWRRSRQSGGSPSQSFSRPWCP